MKLSKKVYKTKDVKNIIKREFTSFKKPDDRITLDKFFKNYRAIYWDIPKKGELSHTTLFEESGEILDSIIDSKDNKIRKQKHTILELEKQLVQLQIEIEKLNGI